MFLLYMNPILIAAAVVPAVFLLIRVYRADRLEPEPSGAAALADPARRVRHGHRDGARGARLGPARERLCGKFPALQHIIMYFVIVAFSEEGKSISCSAAGHGAPTPSIASSTAWCTPCSSSPRLRPVGKSRLRRHVRPEHRARARRDPKSPATPASACSWAYYGRAKRYDNDGDFVKAKRCRTMAVLMPCCCTAPTISSPRWRTLTAKWVFLVFVLAVRAVSLKLVPCRLANSLHRRRRGSAVLRITA